MVCIIIYPQTLILLFEAPDDDVHHDGDDHDGELP